MPESLRKVLQVELRDGNFVSLLDDGSTVTHTVEEVLGPLAPMVLGRLGEVDGAETIFPKVQGLVS